MSRHGDFRLTFAQQMSCSAIASWTARSLTAPLDVVKVRTQVGTPDCRHGIFNSFLNIYTKEGLRAFWKGNFIGCLRLLPYSSIQLMTYHRLKLLLADSCGRLSPWTAFLAGSGAGLTATMILYPTDTVKTRFIVQHGSQKWAHYRSIYHAFNTILREEGIRALYRGVSTSVIGVVPYAGATFAIYELVSETHKRFPHLVNSDSLMSFFDGCFAATTAQTMSFPFDTVRKKMQAYSHVLPNKGGVDVHITNVRGAFFEIIKCYGVRGLWNGLLPNCIKIVPYTGFMFFTYEACKKFCLYQNGYTLHPFQELHNPTVDQSLKPHEIEPLDLDEEQIWEAGESYLQSEEE